AAKAPQVYSAVHANRDDVRDYYGHGTFVAALAAGSVTNGEGIAGFGGDAGLLCVQVARDDGSISDVDEAAGIVYAVDHGATIVNLSLGGTEPSGLETRAVRYAGRRGRGRREGSTGSRAGRRSQRPRLQVRPLSSGRRTRLSARGRLRTSSSGPRPDRGRGRRSSGSASSTSPRPFASRRGFRRGSWQLSGSSVADDELGPPERPVAGRRSAAEAGPGVPGVTARGEAVRSTAPLPFRVKSEFGSQRPRGEDARTAAEELHVVVARAGDVR